MQTANNSLMDVAMADYDFDQRLVTDVNAPVDAVFAGVKAFEPQKNSLLQAAFWLHDAPAMATSKRGEDRRSLSTLQALDKSAMAYQAPEGRAMGELVLGFAGEFWLPHKGLAMPCLADFQSWRQHGTAKVIWDFTAVPRNAAQTRLALVLRAKSYGFVARHLFGQYWRLLQKPSAWVRYGLLMAIKDSVEGASRRRA